MGKWVKNISCIFCNSSDAFSVYEHEDNRQSGYCWSCNKSKGDLNLDNTVKQSTSFHKETVFDVDQYPSAIQPHRGIRPEIYQIGGAKMSIHQSTGAPEVVYYPYYIKDMKASYKTRRLPKEWLPSVGSLKGVDPFGYHLCHGGNRLVIVEGEEDWFTVYQVLLDFLLSKGNTRKPSIISPPHGAGDISKMVSKIMPLIDKYQQIIYIPDQDEQGKKEIVNLFNILPPGKLFIGDISEKDPNEMLLKGKSDELLTAIFKAQPYKPTQIKSFKELYKDLVSAPRERPWDFPSTWKSLNYLSCGRRKGEVCLFTAGTGLGKTTIFKEVIYNDFKTTNENIGMLFLEENGKKTVSDLASIFLNRRLHKESNYENYKEEEEKILKEFDCDRLFILDHFGGLDDSDFWAKMNYLVFTNNCKLIFIDHMNILISEETTVRDINEKFDKTMSKLKKLALKANCWIGVAAHLRKADGKIPFEKGINPTIDDIKGSSGGKQLADMVIGLQGNTTHSEEGMQNVRRLHVLKNRDGGETGKADYLQFNRETGRMNKIAFPGFPFYEKGKLCENCGSTIKDE